MFSAASSMRFTVLVTLSRVETGLFTIISSFRMKNKAALTNMEAVAPPLDQEGVFHSNHFKLKRKGKVDLNKGLHIHSLGT